MDHNFSQSSYKILITIFSQRNVRDNEQNRNLVYYSVYN